VVGVNKNDTNNAVLTKLIHADNTGDHDDSAGAASPIIAGNWATGESSLAVDVAGSQYYIRITPGGTITPAADRIFAVYVSFTRP
jgi:hypothetical protein